MFLSRGPEKDDLIGKMGIDAALSEVIFAESDCSLSSHLLGSFFPDSDRRKAGPAWTAFRLQKKERPLSG